MRASKINEILRNEYKIKPIIRPLDFVQYVIGDSLAVIRRKETDLVKAEQINHFKSVLFRATDRYKRIIFIIHRTEQPSKHRSMGIGAAKKFDRNLQKIAITPRVTLIECLESEKVADTIVHYLKNAANTNKNNAIGVPLGDEFDDDDVKEQKLAFIANIPSIGYSEAIWLLREFEFSIQKIINAPVEKLLKAVPSLGFLERYKFLKIMVQHKWRKNEEDEEEFDKYMEHSRAVKMRKAMQRRNNVDSDSGVALHRSSQNNNVFN